MLRLVSKLLFAAAILAFSTIAAAELTHIRCGGLGDRPCLIGDHPEWGEGGLGVDGCDRGLGREWIGTGACWKFWSCNYRYPWRCAVGSRANALDNLLRTSFDGGVNALVNQIELAKNEPINWVNLVGTHNAYNNLSDNYVSPNQRHSITEQLSLGTRVLFLDVHQELTCNCLKLSHSLDTGFGDSVFDRHLVYGLREIREWLRKHPDDVVILRFEAYLDEEDAHDAALAKSEFLESLDNELGQYILRSCPVGSPQCEKPADRWPTLQELRAMGRRVIVFGGPSSELVHSKWFDDAGEDHGYSRGYKVKHIKTPLNYTGEDQKFAHCASSPELPCRPAPPSNQSFTHVEEDSIRRPVINAGDTCTGAEGPGVICPYDEPCEKGGRHSLYDWCPEARHLELSTAVSIGFSILSFDQWAGPIYTRSDVGVGWSWAIPDLIHGLYWDNRYEYQLTDNSAAVIGGLFLAMYTADPAEHRRFACGRYREGDPSEWLDFHDGNGPRTVWAVTAQADSWDKGGDACAAEFGDEQLVFSVPTNRWQFEDLKQLMIDNDVPEVWVAYRDTDASEDVIRWDIDRGWGSSDLDAAPNPPREGDLVKFTSEWSTDAIHECIVTGMLVTDLGSLDAWDFGDGSTIGHSDNVESVPHRVRFIKWHRYSDNQTPYTVSHSLPPACGADQKSGHQIVYNAHPEIRPDCDVWDECPESIERSEPAVYAGDPIEVRAAIHDAGTADTHEVTVKWGDGQSDTVPAIVTSTLEGGVTATMSAAHTYETCGQFRVDLTVRDDDAGLGTEYQTIQVDERPPTIVCGADVAAEATSPNGAIVELPEPDTTGGICGNIAVMNTAPDIFSLGDTTVDWVVLNFDSTLDPETGHFIHLRDGCTQNVSVVDTTPPDVVAPPNVTIWYSDMKQQMDIGQATVTDAVGVVFEINSARVFYPIGTTIVTWYAMDAAGNIGSDTQAITVISTKGGGALGIVLLTALFVLGALRRK